MLGTVLPTETMGTELSPGAGTLTSPSAKQGGDQGLTSARTAFSCSSIPSRCFPITSWSDLRPASSLLSAATSCSSLPTSRWKLPRRLSCAELCREKGSKASHHQSQLPSADWGRRFIPHHLCSAPSPAQNGFNSCSNGLFYCILWESIPSSPLG